MGSNIDLNTESFAFLNSSRFKTTEWCKACITALALSDQTFNSLSCIPLLVNAIPENSNFSIFFNGTPPTCRKHCTGFLERCSISLLAVLILVPAMSHAAAKPFNACWRPDLVEASKTKSSAKSNRLILYLRS